MTKDSFLQRKQTILATIQKRIDSCNETDRELNSLKEVLRILDDYTYENRIKYKGLVTRVLIDSLQLDYQIGELVIVFDNSIA